jgi:putative transposase
MRLSLATVEDHRPCISPVARAWQRLVQSGFYEVARTTERAARACHATSQNPQDSQIDRKLIQGWKWRSALIRRMLSDAQWERIAPEPSGKAGDPGSSGRDNRLFIEAVLWIARTDSPWRDLPGTFGKWFTVYTRFWRRAQKGVWERAFNALCDDPDFE